MHASTEKLPRNHQYDAGDIGRWPEMAPALRRRAIYRGNVHRDGEKAKPRGLDKNLALEGEARLPRRMGREALQQRSRIEAKSGLAVVDRVACRPGYPEVGHTVGNEARARGVMAACAAGSNDDVIWPLAATFEQAWQVFGPVLAVAIQCDHVRGTCLHRCQHTAHQAGTFAEIMRMAQD